MIEDFEKWIKEKMAIAMKNLEEWKNYNRYYHAGRVAAFREVLNYLKIK